MSGKQDNASPSFEQAMSELEALVDDMEKGDLPLEQALQKFERGISLARTSQSMLKQAEQKVQMLMNENGQDVLVDLDSQDPQD
jgi:exodeoxyribonuclease VII small subunit